MLNKCTLNLTQRGSICTLLTFSFDVHLYTFHPGTWICLNGGVRLRPGGVLGNLWDIHSISFLIWERGAWTVWGAFPSQFRSTYLFFSQQRVPGKSKEESRQVALSGARLEMQRGTESGEAQGEWFPGIV